jgi:hypothetical protein
MDLGVGLYAYMPDMSMFIAPQVLPVFNVAKREGTYSKITRESLLERADAKRAAGGQYNRFDLYAEDGTYECWEYGLEGKLDDGQREMYRNDFDAEMGLVRMLWNRLLIEQEIRTQTLVFNTSTWTGSDLYTDNSGSPWSTTSTDIIGQVADAKEKVRTNTGMRANALILSETALNEALSNDDIIKRFPGATLITRAMLEANMAAIFGLERLIVGGQVYNSSQEGQDFSGSDIWGGTYAMVARVANPGDPMSEPSLGRTFVWAPDAASLATIEEYREEQTRSNVYRARQYCDEKVFDEYFGHLMKI